MLQGMTSDSKSYPTLAALELTSHELSCRDAERAALFDGLPALTGNVVDLQAAGGFLADEVRRRFGRSTNCICVEPSAPHRLRIASHHRVVADELDDMRSLESGSVDVVLGLAGFHHSPSILRTLKECSRMLKGEGLFSVCDVELGSKEQHWLDVVVSQYSSSGHHGRYLSEGECPQLLEAQGFIRVDERKLTVPWRFSSDEELGRFIDGFFNLGVGAKQAALLVEEHLGIDRAQQGSSIPWTLLYWTAQQPPGVNSQ